MPGMTQDEMIRFLDEPGHLVRLGTADPGGMPLVVPIWFLHEGERLLFTPRARSAWLHHLRTNPQACATIDEAGGSMRKVVVQGTVEVLHEVGEDDAWRDIYRRITLRYVPESFGDAYLTDTLEEPRALLALPVAGSRVTTWRMPANPGEDRLAVWAPKYYHDGR